MNAAATPLLLYLSLSFSCCQTVSCRDASPPSSLVVSPSQSQFFEYGSVSISCERFGPDIWTVWRQTASGLQVSSCSVWGKQNSSNCTINTLKTTDSGVYWCESRHRDSSHTVNITVTTGKVVLLGPVLPVAEGDNITLICKNKSGAPGSNPEFFRNGSKMASGGDLVLRNVSRADEGRYACSINGVTSETSWLLIKDVSPPASLTVSPDSAQVLEYGSFNLSCNGSAAGWTIRRFSRDSRRTSSCGGDWGVLLSSSSVCSLQTAKKSDSALYWCESPSKQRSNTVQITVFGLVVLLSPALPVASGRNVTLTCQTRSSAAASAGFYRNGSLVGSGPGSFTLSSVSTAHEGSYTCRTGGAESQPSWLSVRDPDPDPDPHSDPDPDPDPPLHSILWKILYAPVSIFYFIPTCICIYKLRATGWSPAGRTRTSGPRRAAAAAAAAAGGGDYDDAMDPVTTQHHF